MAKLKKYGNNYVLSISEDHQTDVIAVFFRENYIYNSKHIKDYIILPDDNDNISGNSIDVSYDKIKNEFILSDMFYEGDNMKENEVVISKNEFLKIINRWEELLKQKPDEITITQNEDGTFTLTGKFVDDREI